MDALLTEAYVAGVSHRKASELTEALLGERVSRSTVSRVVERLDEQVAALRRAPIEGEHPYLYLDATFLDARWARKVENVSALVAKRRSRCGVSSACLLGFERRMAGRNSPYSARGNY